MPARKRHGGIVALIPARGGSKGLPGKNIRPLAGHPLLAWSIAAAHASELVDRVICSTDSEEIASVARQYGAEVPFMRPSDISGDAATDLDVFDHALAWLEANEGTVPPLVVHLRPTTPFRDPAWIDAAIRRMETQPELTCVRSIAPAPQTPYKMWLRADDGRLSPLLDLEGTAEPFNMPRQMLPLVYWHTGQLDVIRSSVIRSGSMTGGVVAGLDVDGASAIDIDLIEDLQFAEVVCRDRMPPRLLSVMGSLRLSKS